MVDENAGRGARIWQWSIGLQRELSKNLVVEASYVGNRGVWWAAQTLSPWASNGIPFSTLAAYGLFQRAFPVTGHVCGEAPEMVAQFLFQSCTLPPDSLRSLQPASRILQALWNSSYRRMRSIWASFGLSEARSPI